jgi:hypothetical protein
MKHRLLYLTLMVAATGFYSCDDDEEPKTIPVVTTGTVSDITTTSATVSGEITTNGNVAVTATGFVYSSAVSEPTVADDKVELTDTEGDFSTLLEDLSSGTTYHIRAYAINNLGTGYGEVVDFTTGNAAPVASNVSITGDVEVNKVLTATYDYSDPEGDDQSGSAFQWYMANDATGTGEGPIAGATELTYTIQEAQHGKFIRFGVIPKAGAGNTTGTEVKSLYVGAVGAATTVTFIYNGQEVTYGIINSSTGRKWLDRNLGAPNAASSVTDFADYGDLFQWGRLDDGHQLMVRNGPNDGDMALTNSVAGSVGSYAYSSTDVPGHSNFIIASSTSTELHDWRVPQNHSLWQGVSGVNNPCPAGWRIPTEAEWVAENISDSDDAYSKLKLTNTGQIDFNTGNISFSDYGLYWTSTTSTDELKYSRRFTVGFGVFNGSRATGSACRCIKD